MIIGVYGNIGSGKSTVAQYLASKYNFRYLELDQVARLIEKDNLGLIQELKALKAKGIDVLSEQEDAIDPKKMKVAIFDSWKTNQLVSPIIWKYVSEITKQYFKQYHDQNIVVEAAILPVLKLKKIDYYFYVKGNQHIALNDGQLLSLNEIQNKYNYSKRKDFIINNNQTVSELYDQVDKIMGKIN